MSADKDLEEELLELYAELDDLEGDFSPDACAARKEILEEIEEIENELN